MSEIKTIDDLIAQLNICMSNLSPIWDDAYGAFHIAMQYAKEIKKNIEAASDNKHD